MKIITAFFFFIALMVTTTAGAAFYTEIEFHDANHGYLGRWIRTCQGTTLGSHPPEYDHVHGSSEPCGFGAEDNTADSKELTKRTLYLTILSYHDVFHNVLANIYIDQCAGTITGDGPANYDHIHRTQYPCSNAPEKGSPSTDDTRGNTEYWISTNYHDAAHNSLGVVFIDECAGDQIGTPPASYHHTHTFQSPCIRTPEGGSITIEAAGEAPKQIVEIDYRDANQNIVGTQIRTCAGRIIGSEPKAYTDKSVRYTANCDSKNTTVGEDILQQCSAQFSDTESLLTCIDIKQEEK